MGAPNILGLDLAFLAAETLNTAVLYLHLRCSAALSLFLFLWESKLKLALTPGATWAWRIVGPESTACPRDYGGLFHMIAELFLGGRGLGC